MHILATTYTPKKSVTDMYFSVDYIMLIHEYFPRDLRSFPQNTKFSII